jgi:FKBP-type peptidyl-prolyl cis-trans isomerase FkpA
MKYLTTALALSLLACTALAADVAPTETTPSGIKITTLQEGKGATPKVSDTVSVHYKGTLQDGSEFDSSYKRGKPATFPLGRVVPCWTEGVQKMKEGGKAKLVCPPELAYGSRGIAGVIPPNATLTFEIELLKIM